MGIALKPAYGESYPEGPMLSARAGRFLLPHAALRLEAELQSFGAGEPPYFFDAPCPLTAPCFRYEVHGAGPIRTLSALASLQYYEQADRRGFYVLAGFGPQFLASHPDRARAIRLAVQAGAGASLATVAVIEARYQASLGARAEPQHVVLISVGLRYARRSRVPNKRRKLAARAGSRLAPKGATRSVGFARSRSRAAQVRPQPASSTGVFDGGAIMLRGRNLALIVVLVATAGCSAPLTPLGPVVVSVSTVTWGDPGAVAFTVTNTSSQRFFVSGCGSRIMAAVDRAQGRGWQQYSGDGCLTIEDMSPLPVEPGATLTSARGVYGHGRFRIRIGVMPVAATDYSWTPTSKSFDVP